MHDVKENNFNLGVCVCVGEGGGRGVITLLPFNIFLVQFPKFCQLL